uniref:Uncharacterized protein n=1 Tax=Timema poppense TaxID=170557 RepID=A0A7R9D2Q2_TIMPO|nr:unnamed protein product [Timema poppensis]
MENIKEVLLVLKCVRNFLEEHPLSCCYDEISEIKRHLTDYDELKLKQKASSIILKILEGRYYFKSKVAVPDIYPESSISPMASLVLTDSSQLTYDGFEKLPEQIMFPYAEPYDLQKHMLAVREVSCELSVSTKEAMGLLYSPHSTNELKYIESIVLHLFSIRLPVSLHWTNQLSPTKYKVPSNPPRITPSHNSGLEHQAGPPH